MGDVQGGYTTVTTSEPELNERERSLAEREQKLASREAELQKAEGAGSNTVNNWPCSCYTIAYHDIAAEVGGSCVRMCAC